jgi:site-specific recombinase XerD
MPDEKYGAPKINLYNGLKHSFGCQRLNAGFSLDEVKTVMGHTDLRTTGKYGKYATDKLSPVIRNIHRLLNVKTGK